MSGNEEPTAGRGRQGTGNVLIGIAGPSGSGKTELARRLAAALAAPVLSQDNYYFDLAHLSPAERARWNFDLPDALDSALLARHLTELRQGRAIARPVYDFSTHTRTSQVENISPTPFLVVEGLFLLYWKPVRELLDLRVYIDLEDEPCLQRRLQRDVRERGRAPESVRRQFAETVHPMAEKYIHPSREFADLVLRGDAPLEHSIAAIRTRVARRL